MLRLVPLGGLGEIGLNAMVIERGGELLLVDAGLLFPTAAMPGVDRVVPDFSYLRSHRGQLMGVLLTHGHEDHLGALPSLLEHLDVPVFGSPFSLALAGRRLEEQGLEADLRPYAPGEEVRLGSFTVEPFAVCHSTPDAVGLAIRSPEGLIVHTGDFKLDEHPLDGRPTDLTRLRALGDEGVSCLLSDSTNVERLEETRPEREVAETFARLFPPLQGRIAVALFASNLHRVQHLLELFARLGRRVVLHGRSMVRNVELGEKAGVLRVPEGLLVSLEGAASLPREKVALLSTGAQAEPRSGLFQLLSEMSPLKLEPGDVVAISATAIPGNERVVGQLLDLLYARGLTVLHTGLIPELHASGHASRPQQKRLLEAVRPKGFVPVHGELRHLHEHRMLALECGLSPEHALVARDGEVVGLQDGRIERLGEVPAGRVLLDRWGGGAVGPSAIDERLALADGVVTATMLLERDSRRFVAGPLFDGRGLASEELELIGRCGEEVRAALERLSPELRADEALLREELRAAVRRAFKSRIGKRPVVVPQVVKV